VARHARDHTQRVPATAQDLRPRLAQLTLRDAHRLRRRLDRARRHPDPKALRKLEADVERAEARLAKRRAAVPAVSYPPELPVSGRREDLLAAIRDNQVVVVAGETGSGKTTQIPKLCLELGRGVRGTIAHTQPRRLAARTVAERIAEELKVPLGGPVGFAVRFSDRSSEDTLLRLMTDGLLLAEIHHDPLLRRYDTVIVDEAHERSLNIDFLLGYLARILPKRPELKVIITSATIDPERFARHFGGAPVVEVSGRTYPVEVRYAPVDEEQDVVDAIGDACEALLRERRGDVLVFLSGEREIRDAAEALRGRLPDSVELLPLFARLSTAEQQRVFKPHSKHRVVLATNVAETSLTVPGIRSVVDPGTARISRYSARLKVQRLPIESISQASADQRKGRCGRTSDGVAVRLYAEDDFDERPRFTDPEILRTNLAAVILRMAALELGDIEAFPFLDPPDRRQVRDGVRLLQELGAIDAEGKLTRTGRRLAQLQVDPRMGRMILEAGELDCAAEVIPIVAALSIQDPRERPQDQRAQADQRHARFADETSDFLAYLNLWRYLREQQRALSGSQFRKRCKAEYLHYLRVREWQDLAGELRRSAKELGISLNQQPAEPATVHRALLSGLLSHIGVKDAQGREYLGARGARFAIFPGSALAKKPPAWVMVAELVETSRLWGRDAARIDPKWVEPLAEHLVSRTYSEPRWVASRASVVATERVTLYGLPIVTGRTVQYGRIDPSLSRELFIRRALVEGEWETRHDFWAANQALLEEVDALEQRARRRDLRVSDDALFAFYDERIPPDVVSGAHFDRWWRDARRADPDLLTYTRELLVADDAADALDRAGRPSEWKQGDLVLPLSYRFEPGAEHDGVTVHVPLKVLPQLRDAGFDWLVPAFREELVTALIRSLPKDARRRLVPVPEIAAEVHAALRPRKGRFTDQVAVELGRLRGVRVTSADFDLARLPAHLRMTFRVEDELGEVVAEGTDLAALRERVRPRLRAELAQAARGLETGGLTAWTIGELPKAVALPGTGQAVRGYPALVDEGDSVAVRVLETPAAQAAAMAAGTRRLLLLGIPSPIRGVQAGLTNAQRLALAGAPHDGIGAVLADATTAALDALIAEAGGPAWDKAAFERLRGHVAGRLQAKTGEVVAQMARILDAARDVDRRLESLSAPAFEPARRDVRAQLARLVHAGFATRTGTARLADVERYLQGAARRLERLPDAAAVDRDRMRAVEELEQAYRRRLDTWPRGRSLPSELRDVRWMLEELRISQFAQGLGTRGPVSAKRIRRAIEQAAA
jgi:ATP-dependent helicase HrpA